MKLSPDFVTHRYQDVQLMTAVGAALQRFHGLVRSNETAAFVIDCLREETDEAAITARLTEIYDVDEATAAQDVHNVVEKLRSIGAVIDTGEKK